MKKLPIGSEESKHLRDALNKLDYFKDLGSTDTDYVLNHISLYEFEPDTTLIKQGSKPAQGLFIVHEGEVDVEIRKWFLAPQKTIKTLGPGEFFGEIALIKSTTPNATVRTKGKTQVFILHIKDFERIAEENPGFRKKVCKVAEERKAATAAIN